MSKLKGFTAPRTPRGTSSIVPAPPWYYAGQALAVEFEADVANVAALLPDGLDPDTGRCTALFADWQFASEGGYETLDPAYSQYREALFLVSAKYEGKPAAFCPFISADSDMALMRGYIQGFPKQLGSVWLTRTFDLPSKASPPLGPGGQFGATLSVKDRMVAEARITLREQTDVRPSPAFGNLILVRHLADLTLGKHDSPSLHELVQIRSRDAVFSKIWRGDASLTIHDHPYLEVADLRPLRVLAGYRFSFAYTVDDLAHLRDLRSQAGAELQTVHK